MAVDFISKPIDVNLVLGAAVTLPLCITQIVLFFILLTYLLWSFVGHHQILLSYLSSFSKF